MKNNIKLKQQGVALFVSLMFLIIITILSLSAMNSSIMEQKMSSNNQHSMEALQYAQSIQDYFYAKAKAANIMEINDISVPRSNCFNKSTTLKGDACDLTPFPVGYFTEMHTNITSETLTGLFTAEIIEYPETQSQSKSTDTLKPYELVITYDNTVAGFGQATIVLGISGAKAVGGSSVDTGDVGGGVAGDGETLQL